MSEKDIERSLEILKKSQKEIEVSQGEKAGEQSDNSGNHFHC